MEFTLPLFLLAAILLGFISYKAYKCKKISIWKSATIQAPFEEVHDMVLYQKNFPMWFPFSVKDPTQTIEIKGEMGSIGSQYHWAGQRRGTGYQEIIDIQDKDYIGMQCKIEKPFAAKPVLGYSFLKTPSGTAVNQEFKLETNLFGGFLIWVLGTEKKMDRMNARGLRFLKKEAERKNGNYDCNHDS